MPPDNPREEPVVDEPSAAHAIAVTVHGRYLTRTPASAPHGFLVGFHGQGETAEIEMAHLAAMAGDRPWLLVSVQGLNRYYTRRGDVVAAWMTRADRDLAMADNLAYVAAVVAEVQARHPHVPPRMVYSGFSQGVAMAYRAAAFAGHACQGLIVLAGDLPPDVAPVARRLPPVLLGRGASDEWYTAAKAAEDGLILSRAGVPVTEHVFEDGHVRHSSFTARAGVFLDESRHLA